MPKFIVRSRYTTEQTLMKFLTEKFGKNSDACSIKVSLHDRLCLISVPDNL